MGVFIEGRPPLPVGVFNMAKYRPVSAGYFETIGIPLLRGTIVHAGGYRRFAVGGGDQRVDGARGTGAERTRSASGCVSDAQQWRTVIGVVGDVLHEGLDGEAKPEMYVPIRAGAQHREQPDHRGAHVA